EEVATAQIFGHFGLIVPDVPLLDPEFANPLFVVTLADSLSRAGHKTLPPGARHLRWVFDLWLNGVNQRAAELLDFDPREERVQKGASALATAMSECGVRVLSAEQAKALLEAVHPAVSWSQSLLRTMVHEDVIQRFQ